MLLMVDPVQAFERALMADRVITRYAAKSVGTLVRYIGGQHPKLAGMEGEIQSIDGDHAEVQWKNGSPNMETKIQLHELKTINSYSKRFR
jgi:hypothetical protein